MDKHDRAIVNLAIVVASVSISGLLYLCGVPLKMSNIAGVIAFVALQMLRQRYLELPPFRLIHPREQEIRTRIAEIERKPDQVELYKLRQQLAEIELRRTYRA
jgi:hypothetical protein